MRARHLFACATLLACGGAFETYKQIENALANARRAVRQRQLQLWQQCNNKLLQPYAIGECGYAEADDSDCNYNDNPNANSLTELNNLSLSMPHHLIASSNAPADAPAAATSTSASASVSVSASAGLPLSLSLSLAPLPLSASGIWCGPGSLPFDGGVSASVLSRVDLREESFGEGAGHSLRDYFSANEHKLRVIAPIEFSHKHSFDRTIDAFFHKFPTEKHPEMVGCPLVSEDHDSVAGTISRKRLILVENVLPSIFRHIVHSDFVIFEEESVYDYRNKILTFDSRNRSFSSIATACEWSKFSPHPITDQQRLDAAALSVDERRARNYTYFHQYGGIHASWVFGLLKLPVESFMLKKVREGGSAACQLLEDMLNNKYQ